MSIFVPQFFFCINVTEIEFKFSKYRYPPTTFVLSFLLLLRDFGAPLLLPPVSSNIYFFFPIKLVEIPIAASFKKATAKASRTASIRQRQGMRGLKRRRPRQLLQCRRMMMLDGCTGGCLLGSPFYSAAHYRNGTLPVPLKNAAYPFFQWAFYPAV